MRSLVSFSATREQAYVYAISSASLVYTIAKACSTGALHHCTCAGVPKDAPPEENFQWGGCGDNIRWGMHFAKRFVDTIEKNNAKIEATQPDSLTEHDKKLLKLRSYIASINLHNNKVGRRVRISLKSESTTFA